MKLSQKVGKIEDHRIVWDAMTFAQQLGIGQ
jgi:hypothetical protein